VAAAQPEGEVFEDIVVEASPSDWRVSATVSGHLERNTLVTSDPRGMECGAFEYRYVAATRQCWMRARAGVVVTLTARHTGRYGADWAVDWTGCEPAAGAATCQLVIPRRGEMQVTANFRRL
jgi:hypothetical protein